MCVRSEPIAKEEVSPVSPVIADEKPRWPNRQNDGSSLHARCMSPKEADSNLPVPTSSFAQLLLVIRETTQPIHIVALAAVLVLSAIFFPSKASQHETKVRQLLVLLHLTAFSIHFGSQIWMTFVSGLSLYFTLPRHVFGEIQKVLFPLYFTLTGTLSLITLYTYSQLHSIEDNGGPAQLAVMCACFTVQLFTRVYLCPPLVRFMELKHKMEKMASPSDIVKCPQYVYYSVSFRRAHTATAMCNIFTMACTTFHLNHLAQQLCM